MHPASGPPSRSLYGLERVWLVADATWPPFVNQLVVEGDGRLDRPAWTRAIEEVIRSWPAACIRLRGVLGWTRWVAGGPGPRLTEVDAVGWEGRSAAPFTEARLDPLRGPVVEVMLLRGDPPRVMIRTHHAAFDGRSTTNLAEDLFAALAGRPIQGGGLDGPSDRTIAAAFEGGPSDEPALDRVAPTGAASTTEEATRWRRVSVPGSGRRRVLPAVLAGLARAAAPFTEGPLRVSVPVDLRRHLAGTRATGNLTGLVHLDLVDDADGVHAALAAALVVRAECGPVRAADRLRNGPLAVLAGAGRSAARATLRTGRCRVSATVSNLGRMDMAGLSGGGFTARAAWWIPPQGPGTPLFLTVTGHPGGLELCGGMPVGFASEGRLEQLLSGIAAALSR